ncbi:MAG: hypothetical protein ACYTE6_04565 [Planctomycetota bacterium]|jgi:hypothetical protein
MDAHRLRSVIDLIVAEHRRHNIYNKLARVQQTLDKSASKPCAESDEQFRGALTDLLAALRATTVNDMVESDRRILVEIGGDQIAGNGLAERSLEIANERPFLPARAKAAFAKLAAEVENRIQALCATQGGLQELNVDPVRRGDDSWELGVLLPTRLIGGDLERLWSELKEWNQVLRELLPLFTAAPPQVALRTHSSERFELAMPLDRDGALALGVVISRVYEMFREVQANRDRAADLEKQSYPSEIVSGLMGYEHQLVGKQMSAIKEDLTKRYVRRGAGKPKEVAKLLDKGLRFLAIRIREGVEVEIAGPRAAAELPLAEAGHDPVTHHVRLALQMARQAKPQAPSDQKAQEEPQAPRLPLSKIAEPDEGEKKAA